MMISMKLNGNTYKDFYLIIFSIIILLLANYFHLNFKKPEITLNKQISALNIDNNFLSIFSMGQKRLISDIIWISTLLDSDLSHYKSKDLNSWMFLRFNTIATLDPYFLNNYTFGGQYLSIIKDDLLGAEIIFDKGLSYYPNNFELNMYSGFLQAFELKNYSKAYKNYNTIVDHPKAPAYIPSLLVKLNFSTSGDLEMAYSVISDLLKNSNSPEDSIINKKFKNDLYSIKAEIDLKCLNEKRPDCDLRDEEGNYYIKKGNKYVAPKNFTKYQLKN